MSKQMTRLEKVLTTSTGVDLDAVGLLLDTPRKFYGPGQCEADSSYRTRLKVLPLVQLLTYWMEPDA